MPSRLSLAAAAILLALQAHGQEIPQSLKDAVARADAAIAKIVALPASERTFENTFAALDDASARLDGETSLFLFMQNVSTDAKVRDDARAAEEFVVNWSIDIAQREDLYKVLKDVAERDKSEMTPEAARLIAFTMRDYRRSGMDLPKEKRDRLGQIEKELQKLGVDFETNIAEDQTKIPLLAAELKGVPKDVLDRQLKVGGVYLFGFDGPSYGPVMDYCEVEATRQKMQWLYRRRGGQKNVDLLQKMLPLRWEQSSMLGYKTFVDYVVEPRMAKNAATIQKFYADLKPIVRKKALADFAEFSAAKKKLSKDPKATLMPWDYSFVKNYLMRTKYQVDGQKVAEYFPMEAVVKGLFDITQRLYGVDMVDVTAKAKELGMPVWHPDVKLYEFKDKASGALIGRMYTDLYPRDNKYSHAACWTLNVKHAFGDGTKSVPLCALVCNFSKGTKDKPSLLPHDEVETFFHEFGHGLHNLFSDTRFARFAGTGVSRDFVEAPSQMMENWVWSPTVLKTFARHYKSGAPIPTTLLNSMNAAHTLGSGIETEGQIYLGEMDQTLHLAKDGKIDTTKAAWAVYDKDTLYKHTPGTFYQASFGHLNGYEAAYYGYLWSLVYAQDMFQRFEQLGLLDPKTGAYYREKVLARGGSRDESALLKDYLGREPKMDAFLKHLGLKK